MPDEFESFGIRPALHDAELVERQLPVLVRVFLVGTLPRFYSRGFRKFRFRDQASRSI